MKKFILALAVAAGLNTVVAPVRNANAGLLLLPAGGVGVVFIILGLVYDSLGLVILDADGTPNQDQLERALDAKYSFIGDGAVVSDLASALRSKAASTAVDSQGRKNLKLNRGEVLEILEPTGLVELEPAKVEQLIADLG